VFRRPVEPEITREDVNLMMAYLMRLDAKVEEIRALLLEDEDGEENREES
jgi:hypothetical protein